MQSPSASNAPCYEERMAELQLELVRLQYWVKQQGLKVVLIFEGRDAAGKGGTIKRITEPLNPRGATVVALPAPSDREQTQWYFQRYVAHLPAAGEIVILDRSWYNRGGVERVLGFCTPEQHAEWLRACPEFERMLVRSGIILLKYWFSVSDGEQERRFQERASDPLKRWKLSPMDLRSREKWVEFSRAKDEMFAVTDIPEAPWFTIESDDKRAARLNCITHLLTKIPYEDALPGPISLPPRPPQAELRAPAQGQTPGDRAALLAKARLSRAQTNWAAAWPEAHAHWKLKPPRWPVTSSTSPMKYSPGLFSDSKVLGDTSRVSTPPRVTSAVR